MNIATIENQMMRDLRERGGLALAQIDEVVDIRCVCSGRKLQPHKLVMMSVRLRINRGLFVWRDNLGHRPRVLSWVNAFTLGRDTRKIRRTNRDVVSLAARAHPFIAKTQRTNVSGAGFHNNRVSVVSFVNRRLQILAGSHGDCRLRACYSSTAWSLSASHFQAQYKDGNENCRVLDRSQTSQFHEVLHLKRPLSRGNPRSPTKQAF